MAQSTLSFRAPMVRLVVSGLAIIFLAFMIVLAARFGFSRLLSRYALVANAVVAADEAVKLTPSDPEAHRARAIVLSRLRFFAEARQESELATSLRPLDDYLWLELGILRDELGDTNGALEAFNQAVLRAPYYAHTRWQRGNLLLRMGRYDEAFSDLRAAAKSNRTFLPSLIDLAWALSHQDAGATAEWVQISDEYTRTAFARFLAKEGRGGEVLAQLQSAGSISDENRKDIVRQLLRTKSYREAFQVWRVLVGADSVQLPIVYDGGFEGPLTFEEVGFGWRVPRELAGASLALDTSDRQSGTKSLRVTFAGTSNPSTALISQTILVKPQQHYRINFSVRTKDVVSGGLPLITVSDPVTGQPLGKSENFPESTTPWQTMSFEFTVLPQSDAIVLNLLRNNCSSSPCPIFGVVWLDSFSIEELKR